MFCEITKIKKNLIQLSKGFGLIVSNKLHSTYSSLNQSHQSKMFIVSITVLQLIDTVFPHIIAAATILF